MQKVGAEFNFRAIEARWRRVWAEAGTYRTPPPSARPKMYILDFFPYPSGEGLSVGHGKNYVPSDVLSRYYRMQGYAVLHPMGWDAFGLPAENEALLRGRHPRDTTQEYAVTYKRQLDLFGCSYDWSREIFTSDPSFYRWTQWGFLLLLRRGLAYRGTGWQWWCPKCGTILANEQVEGGRCWRHRDTAVQRRALEQWYMRTTAYADRLLRDLETVDWPGSIKAMQRNWIGRSEGVDVHFQVLPSGSMPEERVITVFTTRVETLYGVTFLALAPEHPLVNELCEPTRRSAVDAYVADALHRSALERVAETQIRAGVFTGAYARHPLTGQPIPIVVADCVLTEYGTGAIMGVPAHDVRDWHLASAMGLPVRMVIGGPGQVSTYPKVEDGILRESGPFDGMPSANARDAIAATLERQGRGARTVRYRMRDFLVSRQRYWGAPIPIVYCERCGIVPVPEEALPVLLPAVEQYASAGTGRSPLAAIPEFVHTTCPSCHGTADRETDTLDGFADSNWYFLRFVDPAYAQGPWNPEAVRYWLPVDWYIGGAEHAVMHLLYARFFTKVLYDEGLVSFSEPFTRLRNQGSMLSPLDGMRMSKSRGNVVTPDEIVAQHGADALRVYELFIGPFDQDVKWDSAGIAGAARFVRRLFTLLMRAAQASAHLPPPADQQPIRERVHRLIKAAGEMIEQFRFNGLVAELMGYLNALEAWEPQWRGTQVWYEIAELLTRVCAPITPFLAEEVWQHFGGHGSVHQAPWPSYDPDLTAGHEHTIIVQVNGRVRDRVRVTAGIDQEALIDFVSSRNRVQEAIGGRPVSRVIVVPHRLVNFVTG